MSFLPKRYRSLSINCRFFLLIIRPKINLLLNRMLPASRREYRICHAWRNAAPEFVRPIPYIKIKSHARVERLCSLFDFDIGLSERKKRTIFLIIPFLGLERDH
jgi:hypothetical protein